MVRKMLVKEVRGYQLQHCVPQKLHPLIGPQGQVVKTYRSVSEGTGKKSNMSKFNACQLLKLNHLFQNWECLDPVSVPSWLLGL